MFTSRSTRALFGALTLVSAVAATSAAQVTARQASYAGYRLSGTYELDTRRSDNAYVIVNRATERLPEARRERVARNWNSRLNAPEVISIDVRGRSVTLMSSAAPQLSFVADGRNHIETAANGRTVTTNTVIRDGRLIVSTSGNRGADFSVTFEQFNGGMRVTRRLDSEMQGTSVQVQSFYRRVGEPRWNVYAGANNTPNRPGENRGAEFVPDGTRLMAYLDSPLNADAAREGDRVTLTVRHAGVYDNAVIGGFVTRSGSNVGIDFENIRLVNGRTTTYDGMIDAIRTPDGKTIRVDNSTIADERKRSTSGTLEKGAIGAGIGAIIGAIVGGKEGAAIGAVAGGAGLILMDPKTDQRLPQGTEFTISTIRR